jgi:hypothetical protein
MTLFADSRLPEMDRAVPLDLLGRHRPDRSHLAGMETPRLDALAERVGRDAEECGGFGEGHLGAYPRVRHCVGEVVNRALSGERLPAVATDHFNQALAGLAEVIANRAKALRAMSFRRRERLVDVGSDVRAHLSDDPRVLPFVIQNHVQLLLERGTLGLGALLGGVREKLLKSRLGAGVSHLCCVHRFPFAVVVDVATLLRQRSHVKGYFA